MRDVSELIAEARLLETDETRRQWCEALLPEEKELLNYEIVRMAEYAQRSIETLSNVVQEVIVSIMPAIEEIVRIATEAGLIEKQSAE